MTVIINFNVRNLEWYWPPQRMKQDGDYYEQFKMLNEDKIPKHIPTWAYQVGFDVIDVQENRNTHYETKFSFPDTPTVIQSHTVDNMTHVTFIGEKEKLEVAISNDIMQSFLGAKQAKGKYYWYFYIKADAEYERVTDLIWLSKSQTAILPK